MDKHQNVCKLQACVRGMLVRRQLARLRQTYEVLVQELGDPGLPVHVTWSRTSGLPCVPTVLSKKKSGRPIKQIGDEYVTETGDQGGAQILQKDATTETDFPQNSDGEDKRKVSADCDGITRTFEVENTGDFQAEESVKNTTAVVSDVQLEEFGHESGICHRCKLPDQLCSYDVNKQLVPPEANHLSQPDTNSPKTDTMSDARGQNSSPLHVEEAQDKGSAGGCLDYDGSDGSPSDHCRRSQGIHDDLTQYGRTWPCHASCMNTAGPVHTGDNLSEPGPAELQQGDNTSVWVLEDSVAAVPGMPEYPQDSGELGKMRSHVSMELLWVQQAISSRKHYLRMKQKLDQ